MSFNFQPGPFVFKMARNNFIDHEFEEEFASDDEIRDDEHGKLLQAVHMMDSQQRIKPPTRTEPSLNVSEFDLAPVEGGSVNLKELAHSLESKGKTFDVDIADKIHKLTKTKETLEKPLEKPQAEKIKRIVAYKNLKKQVRRWDAVVHTNRAARTLKFPMNIEPVRVRNTTDLAAMWQKQTPSELEAKLNELRGVSQVFQEEKKEEERFRLTLEELREKRREMAKLRAHQSFEIARARRQNKIKSKSYHRVLRRDKMQQQLKEFESLQKSDPEAALKRLEELERVRAEERSTLRHKSTGHWARSRLIRAKYDTETRQQLAEQLAVSRDLTKKSNVDISSDEDEPMKAENELSIPVKSMPGDEDNPWIPTKTVSEIDEFLSGYRKYWEALNNQSKNPTQQEIKQGEKEITEVVDTVKHAGSNEEIYEQSCGYMDVMENEVNSAKNETQESSVAIVYNGEQTRNDSSPINLHEHITENNAENKMMFSNKHGNAACNENKKSSISVDTCGGVPVNTGGCSNVSELEESCEKNKKCKKTLLKRVSKNKVISTSKSWVVTPVTDDKPIVCAPSPNEVIETVTSGNKIDIFLNSVVPEASVKEITRRKKKKSNFERMFENAENEMYAKMQDKFNKLKESFVSTGETYKFKTTKKNDDDDLGASLALKDIRPTMKEFRKREDRELSEGSVENSKNGFDIADIVRKASTKEGVKTDGVTSGDRGSNEAVTNGNGGFADVDKSTALIDVTTKPSETNINPKKFIAAKPKVLFSVIPDLVTTGEEVLDDVMEEDQQKIITEAFADDDVMDNFRKEKEEEIKKSQPGEIDLSLPGWGEWAGTGIEPSKKKKRFIIKPPSAPPRRDNNKFHVIINEGKEKGIREHQVNVLPETIHSVKDFEATIRAPIGRTWIPETAHKKLTAPAVITKMGKIIKPMDEEFLVNKKTLLEFAD